MNPAISVIVPVYKVENYLRRCIDSILSQSFTDFELLLIDDGSPDSCGRICDEYATKDERVRVFHKPNGGVSSARNLGLENVNGEWVAFIDSDDYIKREYLLGLLQNCTINNVDFIAVNNFISKETDETSVILGDSMFDKLFTVYSFQKTCSPWGKLYRMDIIRLNNLRFNPAVHLGEDIIFVLTYLLNLNRVVLLKSDNYYYEQRTGSLTKTLNSYESEVVGLREFDAVISKLITKFGLNQSAIDNLRSWELIFFERTINSILKLPLRDERLLKYSGLDFSYYKRYKKANTWKEHIPIFLLKNKMFWLFDLLMSNR